MIRPIDRLAPPAWLTAPASVAIFDALAAAGGTARFVGGAVRNLLRGAPVSDLDMAVDLPPEAVLKALRKAGLKAIATGLAHGTVTALTGERRYEITSLRQDVATDGRHAVVAYGQDWAVDAARRDFTMNALYLDRDGALFDPVGGRADAEAGRVRFIGAPATRLAEDILRLLRFYRLHAAFGAGPPDPAGRAACRAAAGDLPRLSGERVADEMIKLLAAPAAAAALAAMAEDEIWPHLGLGPVDPVRAGRVIGADPAPTPDNLRRLAALCRAPATAAARLRLSKGAARRLSAASEPLPCVHDARHRRAALYRLGRETFCDRVALAHGAGELDPAHFEAAWRLAASWTPPRLPLDGKDLRALGIAEGAAIGQVLRAVEAWWLAGDFQGDHAACLAEAKRYWATARGG